MKTKIKIIKMFIEDNRQRTIREISVEIKSDYKITYLAVQKLIEETILKKKIIGKSTICTLNENYYGIEIYEAENQRKTEMCKNANIKALQKEIISKLNTYFFVLLLFGSYAKRKQTKTSDIDLLFISNEKKFEDDMQHVLSLLPLKVHALFFTEEEFMRMKDAKKSNVMQEAIKNNIILYGIEIYYQLKNA